MSRSSGITVSAVVVFIGSTFTILCGAMMVLASIVALNSTRIPDAPASAGPIVIFEALFFFGFSAWGIATGVGLIKTRQWARISMLIFAAILVLISLPAAMVMAFIPLSRPNDPNLPANFIPVIRVVLVVIYGMIAALGGFWLYFFNKQNVKAQFIAQQPVAAGAPANLPVEMPPLSHGAGPRARPLSITIIGWILLVGSAASPLSLLYSHLLFPSVVMPLCFLGFFIYGWPAALMFLIWMAAQVVAAAGLLKLRNWGRLGTIGLQILGIVNAVLLCGIPANRVRFQQIMESMTASLNQRASQPVPFAVPIWLGIAVSLPISFIFLWFLITEKRAFVSEGQSSTSQF